MLSKASRLVLIKIVLNSLPIYYLGLLKMPKAIAKKIISLQSKFFWGMKKEGKGFAAVSWNQIQLLKEAGVLEVGDIIIKITALLFKWWWRGFHQKKNRCGKE